MRHEQILRGLPVSPGFGLGKVFIYTRSLPEVIEKEIAPEAVAEEKKRFENAVRATQAELSLLKERVKTELAQDFSEFIEAQLEMLKDETAITETLHFIEQKLRNAEFAYSEVIKSISTPLTQSKVDFFKERIADIRDVASRVLKNLTHTVSTSILDTEPGSILVAHDLPPSEACLLDPKRVAGIAVELGGKTSHTAIMTKALEIPAVLGVENLLSKVTAGQPIVIDGNRGIVIINPTGKRNRFYQDEQERYLKFRQSLVELAPVEATTEDGKQLDLSANIEFIAEAFSALRYGARGIGLFRTEYLYLTRGRAPTEDEQTEVFTEVVKRMKPYPVIIRTFDLGGDKMLPGYTESNPFLGWRAIRFCLENVDFFKSQLRAILRASAFGNVKIMFPMIATLEELKRAKLILEQTKNELRAAAITFDDECEVGIMVETPSAAIMAESLARECNFFSIGSNDLTQYTLAVDRGNEKVAKLYDNFHPSVLRLIDLVIKAGHKHGIWIGLCGEFAANPLAIPLLVGLGIDELSMSPSALPQAKKIIRSLETQKAVELARRVIEFNTPLEVTRFLKRELPKKFPGVGDILSKNQKACLI
jgi:phosphotransferase system enzyme I (PtsI)